MKEVIVTGSRLAGLFLLVTGFTLSCVMVPLGVRVALPPVLRVLIFLTIDVAIPLAFGLWGLYELRSMERYEIINSGHDLRVVRRSLTQCRVCSYSLDRTSVVLVGRGLTGHGAGFTRLYDVRLRPTGGASPSVKVGVCGHETALKLANMFAEAGCEVEFSQGARDTK